MSASERLKQRWRERPEEMRAALAKANAKAGKRNRTRWRRDRGRMLSISRANAAKGSAKLAGSKFSAGRLKRHGEALRGRVLGGILAKGPTHLFAREFCLVSPEGQLFRGRNVTHFVRSHPDLFDPLDTRWRSGGCNACGGLSKVLRGRKKSWKGWELGDEAMNEKSLRQELIERRENAMAKARELRAKLGEALAELSQLDAALKGFGIGQNTGLADAIRADVKEFGGSTNEQIRERLLPTFPTLGKRAVKDEIARLLRSGELEIARAGERGKRAIYRAVPEITPQ